MDKLDKYRKKIDVIDSTIVKLLAKRMRVVDKVGKYKKRHDMEVHQPDRWAKVVKRIRNIAEKTGALDTDVIERIWDEIHEMAKGRER